MEHDKIYAEHEDDMTKRHAADQVLAKRAWQRVKSRDAGMRERAAALAVTGIVKAKTKLGLGMKEKKKMVALRKVVEAAKRTIPTHGATAETTIKSALKAIPPFNKQLVFGVASTNSSFSGAPQQTVRFQRRVNKQLVFGGASTNR